MHSHLRHLISSGLLYPMLVFGAACSSSPGPSPNDAGGTSNADMSTPDRGDLGDNSSEPPVDFDMNAPDGGHPGEPSGKPDMNSSSECDGESDRLVCNSEDPKGIYRSDLCFNPTRKKTTCASALSCELHSEDGEAHCACPLTGETACRLEGNRSSLYEPTTLIKKRACSNARREPTDNIESCGFGTVCFQEEGFNNGEALCHRSIDASQSDSPYYNHSCGTFALWMRNPTMLEIDCRCRTTTDGQGGAGGTGTAFADPNNLDIEQGGHPAGAIVNCASPSQYMSAVWPIQYGSGPSFNAWFQQNSSGASWFSGVLDPNSREMFAVVRWTNSEYIRSSTIVAWNIDTKDRRVVSGLHPDTGGQIEYGSGYLSSQPTHAPGEGLQQPLTGVSVIRFGPDGMLYAAAGGTGESSTNTREIVRIDPNSGKRTLVWRAQDERVGDITAEFGQCFRPDALGLQHSIAFQSYAFEVGPDGTFYMSMHGIREGDGIVTISPDGKTCKVISRWGGGGHNPQGGATPVPAPEAIGAGPSFQFPVEGLLLHDGLLYGVSNKELYSFDLTTGDRVLKSDGPGYAGMGTSNMFWDSSRNVIWAAGGPANHEGTIIDLTTGRTESIYSDTGREDFGDEAILNSTYSAGRSVSISMLGNSNVVNRGGLVLDPQNPDMVFAVLKSGALMKMELSTFNTIIHSW